MEPNRHEILIDRREIARRVGELGRQIAEDLKAAGTDEILLIPIMTGSLIFVADLIRNLPLKMRIGLVTIRSYPGTATTSQGPVLEGSLPADLTGRHLLVVEDILDSGQTLRFIRQQVGSRHPASLRIVTLLRKDRPQALSTPVDYVGFDIPDRFVAGYGLDYDGYHRNLPDVVVLNPEPAP